MGQPRPLFCLFSFSSGLSAIQTQIVEVKRADHGPYYTSDFFSRVNLSGVQSLLSSPVLYSRNLRRLYNLAKIGQ